MILQASSKILPDPNGNEPPSFAGSLRL